MTPNQVTDNIDGNDNATSLIATTPTVMFDSGGNVVSKDISVPPDHLVCFLGSSFNVYVTLPDDGSNVTEKVFDLTPVSHVCSPSPPSLLPPHINSEPNGVIYKIRSDATERLYIVTTRAPESGADGGTGQSVVVTNGTLNVTHPSM